ncbi:MAG: IS1634 family transposase [Bacillota bacterium]|nr:IS1634 family transposase [Bacillota bacterium]
MFLKVDEKPDGRIYMSFARSIHVPGKYPRTKVVKSLGYDVDYLDQYDDPIAHFRAEAKRLTELEKETGIAQLDLDLSDKLNVDETYRKNLGFLIFSYIYHELGLDKFMRNRQRYENFEFDANAILKLLVYGRLLFPGSKRKTWKKREMFFENFNFTLESVYRCLSYLAKLTPKFPEYLNRKIRENYGRNTETVYYDVTNYYFEIDEEDEYRRKGMGKDKYGVPIIQMGLFLDADGLPILYNLFPGNTHDSVTLRGMARTIRTEYELGRIIVVGDSAIGSADNIWYLLSCGYGYIFSRSIAKSSQAFKEYVLDPSGYSVSKSKKIVQQDGSVCEVPTFMMKSQRIPREIQVTSTSGGKVKKVVDEKLVVYWSAKYAKRAKKKRAKAIKKAEHYIKVPSEYEANRSGGASKYIRNLKVDKDGCIREDVYDHLSLDLEAIEADAKLDGYYAMVSSEMEKSDAEIVASYRELWKIEDAFRVSKSDLETRPVYLSRQDRIEAHFLTCYLAFLLLRLVQRRLKVHLSTEKILDALRACNGTNIAGNYFCFETLSEDLLNIGNSFGVDFEARYRTLGEIRKMVAASKK